MADEDQPQRRSSDSTLLNMAQDLGELKGTLKSFVDSQGDINKTMAGLHEKSDKRLESLEKSRVWLMSVAASSGGIGAAIAKFFGFGSGGAHG